MLVSVLDPFDLFQRIVGQLLLCFFLLVLGAALSVHLEAVDPGDELDFLGLGHQVGVDLNINTVTISMMPGKEQPK